jgi:H+/Cl- antiporter ClcA
LTGILFIFEINDFRFSRSPIRWAVILTSVFSTYWISEYLGTPHQIFPKYRSSSWTGIGLMFIAIPMAAYAFYFSLRFFHNNLKRLGQWQLPVGGLILSIILFFLGTRYSGLGTSIITLAVSNGEVLPWDWILKILLTTLTIGIGFKGGEVTPLFFIGATLGAALGQYTGDTDLAKIGMVSVLGALTHTPLAAGVLASELFGAHAFAWAFLLSLWGKLVMREKHLYRFD